MTEPVEFSYAEGASARGALALPAGSAPAPCIVIAHEWWGLNDDMRHMADRLAREGFVALAIDLYGGKSTSDASIALGLANELKTLEAMEVVRGAAKYLAAHARSNGKVGMTGFCLGGAMTLAASCHVRELCAFVPFYGIPMAKYADFKTTFGPIQAHFGARDAMIDPKRAEAVRDAVNAAGGSCELFLYDAGHAFMRQGDPKAYDAPSAKLAFERMVGFFRSQLA